MELEPVLSVLGTPHSWAVELCGFGMVVSAARTAFLLQKYKPKSVLLLGIAGRLNSELEIGSAYDFGRVACYGIGASYGPNYLTAGEMGWKQWLRAPVIGDILNLGGSDRLLLSSTATSSQNEEVHHKLTKFPEAAAEDMEGFGIAVACQFAAVPLQIVRGISNHAGDRTHANWQIDSAMNAVLDLTQKILRDE